MSWFDCNVNPCLIDVRRAHDWKHGVKPRGSSHPSELEGLSPLGSALPRVQPGNTGTRHHRCTSRWAGRCHGIHPAAPPAWIRLCTIWLCHRGGFWSGGRCAEETDSSQAVKQAQKSLDIWKAKGESESRFLSTEINTLLYYSLKVSNIYLTKRKHSVTSSSNIFKL